MDKRPGVLHLLHTRGGGLDAHVRSVATLSCGHYRHWLLRVGGDGWWLSPEDEPQLHGTALRVRWGNPLSRLVSKLNASILHVHHVSGDRRRLLRALRWTSVPFLVTVHDFYWVCPRVHLVQPGESYCGAPSVAACRQCLSLCPQLPIRPDSWRTSNGRVLRRAHAVVCPTRAVADTMRAHFPGLKLKTLPHDQPPGLVAEAPPEPPALDTRKPLVVAVIGALGAEKGGWRVERLAARCRELELPIRWLVVGDTICRGGPQTLIDGWLHVTGSYRREDLPGILARHGPSVAAFPGVGPESWSLTLDEAWACGLPAMVPDLGALGERVAGQGAGWVINDWTRDEAWLEALMALRSRRGVQGWETASERARAYTRALPGCPPVVACYEALLHRKPLEGE